MPAPLRVRIELPPLRAKPENLQATANLIESQVRDRLQNGGDEEITLAPTRDGRKFSGGPLLSVLRSTVVDGKPGVAVPHPAAVYLLKGTKPKGGTLETMRPRRARALSWLVGPLRIFRMKADFPERNYLNVTKRQGVAIAKRLLGIKD